MHKSRIVSFVDILSWDCQPRSHKFTSLNIPGAHQKYPTTPHHMVYPTKEGVGFEPTQTCLEYLPEITRIVSLTTYPSKVNVALNNLYI